MLNDRKIAGTVGLCSNATVMTNKPALTTQATLPSKFVQNGNSLLESSLPKLNLVNQQSSLTEPKKPTGEQAREIKDSTRKVSPAFAPLAKVPRKNETKTDRNGAPNEASVDLNQKGNTDNTGAKKMSNEDCNRAEPQRPVNPFAKSSTSKEQSSSLLDSIKKMEVDKSNSKSLKR